MSEQGYVDLDGVRTYHEVTGDGEPLVLLHGGVCTVETFHGLAAELAPSYRVHLPERRGHGRTPDVPGPLTYEVMAADTVAYLTHLGTGPVHLCGWSDGAVVGLLAALARPDLVRSLVFVGSALDESGLPGPMRAMLDHISPGDLPPFLRDQYAAVSPDGPEHFDVVCERLFEAWRAMPYADLTALGALTMPVLVVAGDHDGVTVAHCEEIRRALPDGHLAVLPGDHGLPMEKPALLAAVVRDFLAGAG